MVGFMFAAGLLSGVAGIIIALATLVTAGGGVVAILLQNRRQHEANKNAAKASVDEAVAVLSGGHAELAAKFDAHASESLERDKVMTAGIIRLKEDSDILFGMIAGVDSRLTVKARKAETRVA